MNIQIICTTSQLFQVTIKLATKVRNCVHNNFPLIGKNNRNDNVIRQMFHISGSQPRINITWDNIYLP